MEPEQWCGEPGDSKEQVLEEEQPELKEEACTDEDSQNEKEPSQEEPSQEEPSQEEPSQEEPCQENEHLVAEVQKDSQGQEGESATTATTMSPPLEPIGSADEKIKCDDERKLKKANSWKTVRFLEPHASSSRAEERLSLFPDYEVEQWTSSSFDEMFLAEDWEDITDDRLLRKKVLEPGPQRAPYPAWGQEVTVRVQGVLEDRTMVEKDCKLLFVIGEGDVNQALEECAMSMQREEIALLLADSQYTYGLLGREPDIPPWAPVLYQLQLLHIRDKPDPLTLPIADRIRIGNQKRERGNFHFQREEYSMAARAYCMALDGLTTRHRYGDDTVQEEQEVREYRVKCLNNLAAAQLKLEQFSEALHTSRDVLFLDPNNVKALYKTGKLLSDLGEYKEAMETLKRALKLEPSTKAIHVELSKLVRRQSGGKDTQKWKAKPAQMFGENIAPFLTPSKDKAPGNSWKFLLAALVVALASLVASVILTARN